MGVTHGNITSKETIKLMDRSVFYRIPCYGMIFGNTTLLNCQRYLDTINLKKMKVYIGKFCG